MCGVVRTDSTKGELIVVSGDSVMPPSITLGSDPQSGASPPVEGPLQPMQASISKPTSEIPTIDLAGDDAESEQLQKAIELSLQEQDQTSFAGISAEDKDVSKALEVSLRDSTPHRRRLGSTPVGLKNIGNSCWFNVVIQPLFHIPSFRNLILRYNPKIFEDDAESADVKVQEKRLIPILRKLFCLLLASERKFIDPLNAVSFFQDHEMRRNTQQDVCEFIHKLLEKLEEEFQLLSKQRGAEKESSEYSGTDSDFCNPIVELFYGQSKKENCEGDSGSMLETFGQYPLTVKEYKDIHESILASMTGGLPDDSLDVVLPVQQDIFFKKLPPVLIFSLSRYEYIKEKQRAEKVHKEFDFPPCLFMDRYMESNKNVIKEKHFKVSRIKQELKSLYRMLEKYQRFGSGQEKYPLSDILRYVLEFAQNKSFNSDEKENSSPQSVMDIDHLDQSDDVEMSEIKDKDLAMNSEVSRDVSEVDTSSLGGHYSPMKKMRVLPPAPHSIFPEELAVLETCLPRWQREVEVQVETLQKSITCLEKQLQVMFEEPSLQCIPYQLHAVVVHLGQASGGHYWVYSCDKIQDTWLKFNDNEVTESDWKEVISNSVGGQNNASAYCLMYVDQTRYDELFPEQKNLDNSFSDLPIDLQEHVKYDNKEFLQELEDSRIQMHDVRSVPATAPNSPDIGIDEEEIAFFADIQTMFFSSLRSIFEKDTPDLSDIDFSNWLSTFLHKEICRLKVLKDKNSIRPAGESLLDFGVYIAKNEEKDVYIALYAYELLWHLSFSYNTKISNLVRCEVKKELEPRRDITCNIYNECYQGWKRHYRTLVNCAWFFITGYKTMMNGNFEVSLHHLMQALILHNELEENYPPGNAKTLDLDILSHCFRKCLNSVNENLIEHFLHTEEEPKASDIAQKVQKLLRPALSFIEKSKFTSDSQLLQKIREKWCQLLDLHTDAKSTLIAQIVDGVLCCPEDDKLPILKINSSPSAMVLYKEYREVVASFVSTQSKAAAQTSDL